MKKFPVLFYKTYHNCPQFVNWDELDNEWAIKQHGQTLHRLAQRGGLTPAEIRCNVKRLEIFENENFEQAIDIVRNIEYSNK